MLFNGTRARGTLTLKRRRITLCLRCCATCQNGCGGAGSDECMDAAHSAVIDGVAYGVCDSNGVTPYDGQPCQRECEEARSWSDFEFEEVGRPQQWHRPNERHLAWIPTTR